MPRLSTLKNCPLVLVLAWIATFCEGNLTTDMKYIRMCNITSPVSLRTMNEFLINKKLAAPPVESIAFKCFLHCLFSKYNWMDEEGGFFLHNIKNSLEESNVEIDSLEYILYKCTAIASVDKCERSFLFTQCFWERMAEQPVNDDQLFYNVDEKFLT